MLTYRRYLTEFAESLALRTDADELVARAAGVARTATHARTATVAVLSIDPQRLEHHVRVDERGPGAAVALGLEPDPELLALIGRDRVHEVGGRGGSDPVPADADDEPLLCCPLRLSDEPWGCLYVAGPAAGAFSDEDEASLAAVAGLTVPMLSVGRLVGLEHRRRRELEGLLGDLVLERSDGVPADVRSNPLLSRIIERTQTITSARAVVLALVEDEQLVVTNVAGEIGAECIGERVPLTGVIAHPLAAREPARITEDVHRLIPPGLRDHAPAHAALLAPLVVGSEACGLLVAYDCTRHADLAFDAEDEDVLRAFASSAAVAVTTARAVTLQGAKLAIDASERERRRWARELHDDVLQQATAVKLMLEFARDEPEPDLRATVDDAVGRLEEQIDELRSLLSDLRPAALDRLGLPAALEQLVDRQRRDTPAEIELEPIDDATGAALRRLSQSAEVAVYRIAQESIANAIRHGRPEIVRVAVQADGPDVVLRVEDDGGGFDPAIAARRSSRGYGLDGMRERAAAEHGTLAVRTVPGAGTVIEARLTPGLSPR